MTEDADETVGRRGPVDPHERRRQDRRRALHARRARPLPGLLAPRPIATTTTRAGDPAFPVARDRADRVLSSSSGYVYAHMDVRGCGKSGGEFRCSISNEQNDLYDVIEWLGHQPWSNGKVGGIGQSYFCMSQWWMAIQKPPSLACIAAFDGLNDPYRASVYQGGILGDFFGSLLVEPESHHQSPSGQRRKPREQTCDLNLPGAAAPDLRRFLARALRRRTAARDRGAALLDRRLGQGRSAHARQHRRLSAAPAGRRS